VAKSCQWPWPWHHTMDIFTGTPCALHSWQRGVYDINGRSNGMNIDNRPMTDRLTSQWLTKFRVCMDTIRCCCCCDSPAVLLLSSVVQVEEVCDRSRVVPQVLHCKLCRMALTVDTVRHCWHIWREIGDWRLVLKEMIASRPMVWREMNERSAFEE